MKNIKVNPLFFPVLLIFILLGYFKEFFLSFATLLFHEAGHLFMIKKRGILLRYIKIEPFGISINLKEDFYKNEKDEIYVAFGGPLVNFIIAFFAFLFLNKSHFFIYANLSVAIFNLIPAYPLDGARILRAYLTPKKGYILSFRFLVMLTKIISTVLFILGVVILYKTRFNFSYCIISAFLFYNLLGEKNHTQRYLLKEISEYKEKNKDIEKMPVKYIAVNKNYPLRKVIYELSYMRYHIFSVIDEGKIIKTFSEGEIIKGLIEKGGRARISDLY